MKGNEIKILLTSVALASMLVVPTYASASEIPNVATSANMVAYESADLARLDSSILKYGKVNKKLEVKRNVDLQKSWKVKVNKGVNLSKLSKDKVKVIDKNGVEQKIHLYKGKNDNELIVKAPDGGYKKGTLYALLLLTQEPVGGTQRFKETTVMPFITTEGSSEVTTGNLAIQSVDSPYGVLWSTGFSQDDKAYKTVELNNILNKRYVPYYRQEWYGRMNSAIPYHKVDSKAFENIDILPIKEVNASTRQMTIVFNNGIDSNSVNDNTVRLKLKSLAETGFGHDWFADISCRCNGNKLIVNFSYENASGGLTSAESKCKDGGMQYLIIDGVKLKGSNNIVKPTILPFAFKINDSIGKLSTSTVLPKNRKGCIYGTGADDENGLQSYTKTKFTRFEYNFGSPFAPRESGFEVARLAEKEYPSYAPIFKEIHKRVAIYDVLHWDTFERKGAKSTKDELKGTIWDRCNINGYNVDVMYNANTGGAYVNVAIYDKGTQGVQNPNLIFDSIPMYYKSKPVLKELYDIPFEHTYTE